MIRGIRTFEGFEQYNQGFSNLAIFKISYIAN